MGSIDEAIADLKSQSHPNITATAKKHGVNRSTLSRRFRGITQSYTVAREHHILLSHEQETKLVEYINLQCHRGLPPTSKMVSNWAASMAGKTPGKNWVSEFRLRHKDALAAVYLKGFDLSRKKADNAKAIEFWFDLVSFAIINLVLQANSYKA